jgi:(S)-2-hydroxyglutarate dehydrogenase
MACDLQGNLVDDFLILTSGRVVNVISAPSPAATASLAIGKEIMRKTQELMGIN